MLKLYGTNDPDPALLQAVRLLVQPYPDATIVMFPRQPPNVRPCQHPNRLRFEIVIDGRAYAAYQQPNGRLELPKL